MVSRQGRVGTQQCSRDYIHFPFFSRSCPDAVSDLTGAMRKLVTMLLSREADIEHRTKKGFTPYILAHPCLWPVAGAVKDEYNRWS
jgi:hypothetical protein